MKVRRKGKEMGEQECKWGSEQGMHEKRKWKNKEGWVRKEM